MSTEKDIDVVLKKADLEKMMSDATTNHDAIVTKMQGEIDVAKTASAESASELKAAIDKIAETNDRLVALEQRSEEVEEVRAPTPGDRFTKSDAFKAMAEGRQGRARLDMKAAIVNVFPPSASSPLAPADRQTGVHATPNRRLTLRDVLPTTPTSQGLVEFVREDAFTNSAGVQRDAASPATAVENVTKPESGITFSLASAPVVTLAHWIPVSKQVLADSPMLASYINGRLMYGLKLVEENQLLKGPGTNGELNGIQTQATTYTVGSPPSASDRIDIIRNAITQAQVAEYTPNFIVLNPVDWALIQRMRINGTGDKRYVYGDPSQSWLSTPLWGLTPIVTNSQTSGVFLIGDTNGAMIFDREQANVEASYEDGSNFIKNMVTIRAEERLALAVFRTESMITGSF